MYARDFVYLITVLICALRYETLPDDMKAKLLSALEKNNVEVSTEISNGDHGLSFEVVEEFMSISDGQVTTTTSPTDLQDK